MICIINCTTNKKPKIFAKLCGERDKRCFKFFSLHRLVFISLLVQVQNSVRVTAHSSDGNLKLSTSAVRWCWSFCHTEDQEVWASVLEASQLLAHQHGTVCRRYSRTCHGQFVHRLNTEIFICSYYASVQPSQHCYKTCVKENTVTELNWTEPHLFLSVCVVISDFAARKQFLMEMEKSAAVMELYDAEFALASTFLQFLL